MKRRFACLPALAAPIPILSHVVSQAIVSGHGLLAVAQEPSHLYELGLSLLVIPLWGAAARARRLNAAIVAFTALTLLCEGNDLSATMLVAAIALAAMISWVGGSAVQAAYAVAANVDRFAWSAPRDVVVRDPLHVAGPYYAFVSTRGNRPPPCVVARS